MCGLTILKVKDRHQESEIIILILSTTHQGIIEGSVIRLTQTKERRMSASETVVRSVKVGRSFSPSWVLKVIICVDNKIHNGEKLCHSPIGGFVTDRRGF